MTDEATEAFFSETDRAYRRAVDECYRQTPEWHGKILHPRPCCDAGSSRAHSISTPMSFSRTLIDIAGGMQNLREHWVVE